MIFRTSIPCHWYGESIVGLRLPRGPEAVERADAVLTNFFARTSATTDAKRPSAPIQSPSLSSGV